MVNARAPRPMRRLAAKRRPSRIAYRHILIWPAHPMARSMRKIALAFFWLFAVAPMGASADEWGPPTADYAATLTFTDASGEVLVHRMYYTAKRQRLDYKAGENDEIAIVDQEAAAVFVLYPAQKRYRKSPLVQPEFDFGIGRPTTKREKIADETVAAKAAVKYRVEAKTAQGQEYKGFAWLTAERIVVKLEGEVMQGRRTRRITMIASALKIGPVDADVFRVPRDYAPIEDKRK
jgi:hypothetical protein